MLQSLRISNIALIENLSVRFHDGMHALTGETGAGKSIVVDAVNLVLGARADRTLIRSGCEKASVEAEFMITGQEKTSEILEREGIDAEGDLLTAYREITVSGRNTCRVCGVLVSLSVLKEIAASLMDIHGQNDHQFLIHPEQHLAFLDKLGDSSHQALMDRVREHYQAFIRNHREYARLVRLGKTKESRMAELESELNQIRFADLENTSEEELRNQVRDLRTAQQVHQAVREINAALGEEENGLNTVDQIKKSVRLFHMISEKDPELTELAGRLENVQYEMEEIAFRMSKAAGRFEFRPAELKQAEDRLSALLSLQQKYGSTEGALRAGQELEQEYERLEGLEPEISHMAAEHKRLLSDYRQAARELSESRHRLAGKFENQMKKELRQLGMEHIEFEVAFPKRDEGKPLMPTETGDDTAEFMMSPNPGEPLKPMSQTASGGELSRIMLAIKVLESGKSGIGSMVFDEIDTGISGRMAQVVAEKMMAISVRQQVICVTHLPQIAAAADHQYLVSKSVREGRSFTEVCELDGEGRVQELARMISGADGINQESIEYGRNMLLSADEIRLREERNS